MFGPKVWALDLGRSAVKGVLMTPVKDGVEILHADIVPLKGEPPEDLKEPSRDMRLWEALSEFQSRNQIHKERVALAISPQNTLVREIKIALVGKRNIEELVHFEASNAIPYVLDEVFWDYHLFDASEDETTKEGIIFAAKKSVIHTYLHALSQVGAERVLEITLSPLAALSFLQFEMGQKGSALLLDLGAENTSMIAMDGPRFWVRNVASGGSRITELLGSGFGLTFEQAEEAKRGIARSELAEQLVEVIKPGLHGLVGELKTNLDYFRRTGKTVEFERVYAVGGGSRLVGLKAQMRQSLGQELHDIRSLEHIFVSPRADVRLIQRNLDRFAAAVGVGIKALDKAQVDVSFTPESTVRMAQASGTKRFLFAAGVLLWGILAVLFTFGQRYQEDLQRATKQSRSAGAAYTRNLDKLNAAKKRGTLEQELKLLMTVGLGREQGPALFQEVVNSFAGANKRPGCRFQLTSFSCDLALTPREGDSDVPDEMEVLIKGKVILPPEGDQEQAYGLLKTRLVARLLSSSVLARATGTAAFADGQRKVVGEETEWATLIKPGDQIMAQEDGIWYKVHEVTSDTELSLTQDFGGGDMTSGFAVVRMEVFDWNYETREFSIKARVPTKVTRFRRPKPRREGEE